jgi:[ribosomal protein S18]-alanine N-acetyltransferase
VTKIHLEVRKKNQDARKFYEANGFHRAGIRPNYYHEPSDDAILLTCGIAF